MQTLEEIAALGRYRFVRAPVKRVKGFDVNTQRAEHKRAKRAKHLAKRLHSLHRKAPQP